MSFCPTPCSSTSILNKLLLERFNVCKLLQPLMLSLLFFFKLLVCYSNTRPHNRPHFLFTDTANPQVTWEKAPGTGSDWTKAFKPRYIRICVVQVQISHFVIIIPEQRCCFLFDRPHNTDKMGPSSKSYYTVDGFIHKYNATCWKRKLMLHETSIGCWTIKTMIILPAN